MPRPATTGVVPLMRSITIVATLALSATIAACGDETAPAEGTELDDVEFEDRIDWDRVPVHRTEDCEIPEDLRQRAEDSGIELGCNDVVISGG